MRYRIHPLTLVFDANDADCWGSEPIFRNGELTGHATSGGYGWRIGKSLAVGWLPVGAAAPGTPLEIGILGERRDACVVADALYDPDNIKLRS